MDKGDQRQSLSFSRLKRILNKWRQTEDGSVASLVAFILRRLILTKKLKLSHSTLSSITRIPPFHRLIDVYALQLIHSEGSLEDIEKLRLKLMNSSYSSEADVVAAALICHLNQSTTNLKLLRGLIIHKNAQQLSRICILLFDAFSVDRIFWAQWSLKSDYLVELMNFMQVLETKNKLLRLVGEYPAFEKPKDGHLVGIHRVSEAALQTLFTPRVYARREREPFQAMIPVRNLYHLEDVALVGANQFLNLDSRKHYLIDQSSSASNGIVAGAWQCFVMIGKSESCVLSLFLDHGFLPLQLDCEAFVLSGRASGNYFHWLIEDLPRLEVFRKYPEVLKSVRYLVLDAQIPKQNFEALAIATKVLGLEHLVWIKKKHDESVRAPALYSATLPTYHPDRFDLPYSQTTAIDLGSIKFLREVFLKKNQNRDPVPRKKIYLSRKKGAARGVVNYEAVDRVISASGFQTVFPELLTFPEQIELFSSASHIVAQSGAGLTNLAFCAPGTKVLAMTAERNSEYPMYSTILEFVGGEFVHLMGAPIKNRDDCVSEDEFVHSPFSIDVSMLRAALSNL